MWPRNVRTSIALERHCWSGTHEYTIHACMISLRLTLARVCETHRSSGKSWNTNEKVAEFSDTDEGVSHQSERYGFHQVSSRVTTNGRHNCSCIYQSLTRLVRSRSSLVTLFRQQSYYIGRQYDRCNSIDACLWSIHLNKKNQGEMW